MRTSQHRANSVRAALCLVAQGELGLLPIKENVMRKLLITAMLLVLGSVSLMGCHASGGIDTMMNPISAR
jgi:hypothetical protein